MSIITYVTTYINDNKFTSAVRNEFYYSQSFIHFLLPHRWFFARNLDILEEKNISLNQLSFRTKMQRTQYKNYIVMNNKSPMEAHTPLRLTIQFLFSFTPENVCSFLFLTYNMVHGSESESSDKSAPTKLPASIDAGMSWRKS